MQKWIKKGLVFKPNSNESWLYSHAAVPIAYHLEDDIYRIYFSSRDKENRSQTAYLELDINNPSKILRICKKPILTFGEIGTFDDSGAMASCLAKNSKLFLYYIGWNKGYTTPFHNSIGLAISDDNGENFQKYAQGPIVDRIPTEPFFTASSYVLKEKNKWKMWYLSGVKWEKIGKEIRPYYHIKYADSHDGITWKRDGIVCIDFKNEKEHAISRPFILQEDGIYKMWYSYRGPKTYRIGYAESSDGINWNRKDEEVGLDVSNSGWDSEMIEYPFIFLHKGTKHMLYNGNNYGESGFGIAILE